ncbi:MAG: class I SAM-dependent methyltransferase [Verrucomicrobiales bacterium]|jgi:SAM-dependent methyltransferase|nr:class I SAM-dependent methyltransferase [Verrucomicrobiales bacterium]
MNIFEYNRNAWNLQSEEGCRWSTPFSGERIEAAKEGEWSVILTPNKAVPTNWFPSYPDLSGVRILALASGGGQQVPIFAAAGAEVLSFDASDTQLRKDEETCARHGLTVQTEQGDMADLTGLDDQSFDLIFNPVSNVFAESLAPIWEGCYRILKPGGALLTGFMNPCFFLFDHEVLEETGKPVVKHRLPYSDMESADAELLSDQLDAQLSLEYSHSWEDQIGGMCEAGFAITGFYEDDWDEESTRLQGWMPTSAAARAVRW